MSLYFRGCSQPTEQRSVSFQDVWGSGAPSTLNGSSIEQGLRLIPLYSAVSLIADMVSTASLQAFARALNGSASLLARQPQLVTRPGPWGSVIDWLHQCIASLLLRGNAYGYILAVDDTGRPSQIVWFHPDEVTVVEDINDWLHRPTYYWRGRKLESSLVVHIAAFTLGNSVKGLSPLALFKLQIETGMQAQQFGADWFENGATPSGVLKNTEEVEVPPEIAAAAKRRFKASSRNRDVFVTGADWDYTKMSVPANESQFLETIKANATQIAAIYRVAPEDIGGETGRTMTYKTLESDNAKLTQRTIRVWARRIDTVLSNLLPNDQEYVAFDLLEMSRGDESSQIAADAAALNAGIETLAAIRARRNLPPLTDAEIAFWQENYRKTAPAHEPSTPPSPDEPPAPAPGGDA